MDVTFRDLCFDTVRPEVTGPYWAGVLGRELVVHEDGDAHLAGADRHETVWLNRVPEVQHVKNRVHLDVRLPDDTLLPAGSALLRAAGGDTRWRVLADPDGLQWCAFGPREGAGPGPFELVVDSADPLAIASWWAARFGVPVHQREGAPHVWLEDVPSFPYPYWVFAPVPEPKTAKNRVHWDVDLADAAVDDLLGAGAVLLRAQDDEIGWTVLADPEGNEFCVFARVD